MCVLARERTCYHRSLLISRLCNNFVGKVTCLFMNFVEIRLYLTKPSIELQ